MTSHVYVHSVRLRMQYDLWFHAVVQNVIIPQGDWEALIIIEKPWLVIHEE